MFKVKKNTIHTRDIVLICVLLLVSFVPAEYMQVFQSIVGKTVLIVLTWVILHYCSLVSCILTVFIVIMVLHTTYEGIDVETKDIKYDNDMKDKDDVESTNLQSFEENEPETENEAENEPENESLN